MTGFARSSGASGPFQWAWELKSVNGKGLDVRFRLPSLVDGIDLEGRKRLSARLSRGSVSATLDLKRDGAARLPVVNREVLERYLEIAAELGAGAGAAPASIDGLMGLKGVIESADEEASEEELAALNTDLLTGLEAAGADLVAAREGEGAALSKILAPLLERTEELVSAARANESAGAEAIRERLAQKIADLLPAEAPVTEERLAQEVTLLAIKADIREELDRLEAHIASARELLAKGSPVGRKLDFLCQEFNREANTLCSKSTDSDLTQIGLEMKTVIDQFREQVQNVE